MKETIIASEPIRFEGDGYSEQWQQEAARRGLTNICHVPEALMHYMDNQSRSGLIGERIFKMCIRDSYHISQKTKRCIHIILQRKKFVRIAPITHLHQIIEPHHLIDVYKRQAFISETPKDISKVSPDLFPL